MRIFVNIVISVSLALLVQGCPGYTTLNMSNMPKMDGGSPLREIKPLKFFINSFEDNILKDPKGDGDIVNPYYYKLDPFRVYIATNRKGSDVFEEVIKAELVRNGHIVVGPSTRSDVDVVIDGKFKEFALNPRSRMDMYGHAEAEITVKVSQESIAKTFTGYFDCEMFNFTPAWEKGLADCMNNTILNLTKNVLIDPDFIHLFNKSHE